MVTSLPKGKETFILEYEVHGSTNCRLSAPQREEVLVVEQSKRSALSDKNFIS